MHLKIAAPSFLTVPTITTARPYHGCHWYRTSRRSVTWAFCRGLVQPRAATPGVGHEEPGRALQALTATLPGLTRPGISLQRPHHHRHRLRPHLHRSSQGQFERRLRLPERRHQRGRGENLAGELYAVRL